LNPELLKTLKELHKIVNNFSITGDGVSGNLTDGYTVAFSPIGTQPRDLPEGPEIPQQPQQPPM